MSKSGKGNGRDEGDFIFRPWITLRNGKRLYAYQCGLRAFKIPIKDEPKSKPAKKKKPEQ